MAGFPYDDLNAWRGPYPAEVFASQFEKVSSGWLRGVTELRGVTGSAGTEDQRLALAACGFTSSRSQTKPGSSWPATPAAGTR